MTQKIGAALFSCAETIWKTADTLRGAGIKEGDFPSYMMPFFALMLLESRLRRFKAERVAEFEAEGVKFDPNDAEHCDWLEKSAKAAGKGYHPELLLLDKGLKETCAVPGGNFFTRLLTHLNQYDPETKRLLGLGAAEGDPKFLDIQGKAADLWARPNKPLYAFALKWVAVDLTQFSNSEVTTIEEHIKRKWGDISAETAGEQYTPSDVIELATSLIVELRREGQLSDGIADIYDMACGGGNFLFATEEALREAFPKLSVRTRGQELNDGLFALAAIEARFREDARIERENTLTNDLFVSDKFDVIVANPPYGVDWKDAKTAVEADASGRFDKGRLPSVSDGQLLFLQHAAFHLSETGVGAIIHNGSTLFSGDAGSGESQTRLWLLKELDIVEAIVQLPKGEFFNTDISTYMWILNKAKPAARKGKVLLINAESCFTKLKRNLNKKNVEVDSGNRDKVVSAFKAYANGPISRVLEIEELLYNRVELELHRHDEQDRAVKELSPIESPEVRVELDGHPYSIVNGKLDLAQFPGISVKEAIAAFNECVKRSEIRLARVDGLGSWRCDMDTGRIERLSGAESVAMGAGVLRIKAKLGKVKGQEFARVEVEIGPLLEKDTEAIPYSSVESENIANIESHLSAWVKEPWKILRTTLGCEISFNRIFPKLSAARPMSEVLADMSKLNDRMAGLELEFQQSLGGR